MTYNDVEGNMSNVMDEGDSQMQNNLTSTGEEALYRSVVKPLWAAATEVAIWGLSLGYHHPWTVKPVALLSWISSVGYGAVLLWRVTK